MKLEDYLRNDFTNNLKPLIIKDKCEICGIDEKLHLHHVYDFSSYLKRCLTHLRLEYKEDIGEYNIKDLRLIRDSMISAQLRGRYKTLCRECHKEEHRIKGKVMYNKNAAIDEEKIKKEREKYNQEVLKPYLDSIIGKILFKEDQRKLAEIIDIKDKQGRRQKSISLLNSYLITNHNMMLTTKRVSLKDNKKKTTWILNNI
jgi:hypothetical protein|uniref:Uncharacterized protein n=1 Tax=virus sp. ctE0n6 TaxID=2827985 RepID=A0A8S5RFQ9_9VIRU|nr:MAG TPA: Protein of unknown function (DUF968) [virus sp. ctE0n6]